jgi:hypothetical protein
MLLRAGVCVIIPTVFKESGAEKRSTNFETIASIEVGDVVLLVKQKPDTSFFFRPVNALRREMIFEQTKDLPSNAFGKIVDTDPDLLNVVQMGMLPTQISWRRGSGVVEEPAITISGVDGINNDERLTVTLYEDELADLFLRRPGKKFYSSFFFSLNTKKDDLIGIGIRRKSPAMIVMSPGVDGIKFTPMEGLDHMLTSILGNLNTRMTPFKADVLSCINTALNVDRLIDLPYDSSTIPGRLQNNILLNIYHIQAVLLASRAEETGLGRQDPELLAHVPFLKKDAQLNGLSSLFKRESLPKRLAFTTQTWRSLLEDVSAGISLGNPHDKSTPPQRISILSRHKTTSVLAPFPKTAVEVKPLPAPQSQTGTVDNKEKIQPKLEKLSILPLAQEIVSPIQPFFTTLLRLRPQDIKENEVNRLINLLQEIDSHATSYTQQRKRGRPPASPTVTVLPSNPPELAVFGLSGQRVLGFLSNSNPDYQLKLTRTLGQLHEVSAIFTREAVSSSDRVAYKACRNANLDKLSESLKDVFALKDKRMINNNIDSLAFPYALVCLQVLYVLNQRFTDLRERGETVEIDNWAHFAKAIVSELIKIGKSISY